MILPKLSAAILSMSFLGSAYAASNMDPDISLVDWVVMSGATNGAADALGVGTEERKKHRTTAQSHLMRYASEHGVQLVGFDLLFERGIVEGKKLAQDRRHILARKQQDLINGFQHDTSIDYQNVKKALDT